MNKSINEIKIAVQKEDKDIEELAFELYCKDKYRELKTKLTEAKESLEKLQQIDAKLSFTELEKSYKGYSPTGDTIAIYKKMAIEKLKKEQCCV